MNGEGTVAIDDQLGLMGVSLRIEGARESEVLQHLSADHPRIGIGGKHGFVVAHLHLLEGHGELSIRPQEELGVIQHQSA